MVSIFRFLLIGSLVLYAGFIASFIFASQVFGEDVAGVLYHNGKGAWVALPPFTWMIELLLWSLATIGMLLFQSWARTLFLLLTGISLALATLAGFWVLTGPQAAVLQLINLIDGAILAVAFLTTVARRFDLSAHGSSSSTA